MNLNLTLAQRRKVSKAIAKQYRVWKRRLGREPNMDERRQIVAIGFAQAKIAANPGMVDALCGNPLVDLAPVVTMGPAGAVPMMNPSLAASLTGAVAGSFVANALSNPVQEGHPGSRHATKSGFVFFGNFVSDGAKYKWFREGLDSFGIRHFHEGGPNLVDVYVAADGYDRAITILETLEEGLRKEYAYGENPQKLLTKEIFAKLPPLRSQEHVADPTVWVKFFAPWTNWTWYATEFDPAEGLFFGLVMGHETELGYFSLEELQSVRGPGGLRIERDQYWRPTPLSQVRSGAKRNPLTEIEHRRITHQAKFKRAVAQQYERTGDERRANYEIGKAHGYEEIAHNYGMQGANPGRENIGDRGGIHIEYSNVNQAWFLMWKEQVLRIFNEKADAVYEYRRILGKSTGERMNPLLMTVMGANPRGRRRPARRAAKSNPGRSGGRKVTISLQEFARRVKAMKDPALWKNFLKKIRGYQKWTHGTLPTKVTLERVNTPGVHGMQITYGAGRALDATYSMPKGSKRKGAWKHPWDSPPDIMHDPEAGVIIHKLRGKSRITDFYHK